MSLDVGGIEPTQHIAAVRAARDVGAASATHAPPAPVEDAVRVDTAGSELPSALSGLFAVASNAWDQLETAGARLHFVVAPSGRIAVEVHDLGGNVRSTISGSDALRIAAGEPVRL
jgi:hypothetical protein